MKNTRGKSRNASVRRDSFDLGFGYCKTDGTKLECIDSRRTKEYIRRRWKCPECDMRLTTHEITIEEHRRLMTIDQNDATNIRERVLAVLQDV